MDGMFRRILRLFSGSINDSALLDSVMFERPSGLSQILSCMFSTHVGFGTAAKNSFEFRR
jgi:hypothetical protein